ncbi:MAG: hypothetical protein NT091_04480 [Candidatus Falkowbacteria bacterium]|nr:hypothetical protein [Candidatus Falkowbacteria bacterium]
MIKQVIQNQENCGPNSACEDSPDCACFNIDSLACHYKFGHESNDCLLNKDIMREIEEDKKKSISK